MPTFRSKPCNFYLVLSCIQLFLSIASSAPIFKNCSGDTYDQNSTFAANLNQLISSLTSKAPLQSFYNASVGEEPDRIYGLFQCRGDINLEECKSCLQTSSTEIKQACPNSTQVVVWYDLCLVQYSDQHFFGLVQADGYDLKNDNFADQPSYDQGVKVVEFVSNLSKQVPYRTSMFATAASPPDSIHSLVQCTMDISKDGCKKCLQDVIAKIRRCCTRKRGWRYSAPSCSVRYETYLFFNGTTDRERLETHHCSDDVNAASLVFNSNLNSLLRTLITNALSSGFYKSYKGDDPYRVYGLVLCRGDLDTTACQNCLNTAWNDSKETCPNDSQAILWYNHCQLRYSNESFFGIADVEGGTYIPNGVDDDNIGSQSIESMYRLVKKASEEKLMFASDQLQVNKSEKRYYYAQCTRDLNSSTCHDCLNELMQAVLECCIRKRGWRYFAASCNMSYEAYPFLNITEVLSPAPQPIAPIPHEGMFFFHY